MSMIRMITYLIGLVLPMIMDGYGSWTLWRILFHHGSSLVRSNEVASWNHYITYASTSWGFHPWGNLVSNPNHQPGCPKSPYKKNDSMPNQIPNHSRFFFRATKINQQKSTHTSFAFKIVPSPNPPPKKMAAFLPQIEVSFNQKTRRYPPRMLSWHVIPSSPRLHGIRHAGGTQTESEDEARGQRRDKTAAKRRVRSAFAFFRRKDDGRRDFFLEIFPSRKPKRSEKQQKTHRCCWSSLLRWFVGWFFFWGGGKRKRLHKKGQYSQVIFTR